MEWTAINSYFANGVSRLVEHQIESFEDFIRNKLPLIVSSTAPIVVWHEQDEKTKKYKYEFKINLTENQYLQIATGKPKKELNQKKNFIHGLIKKAYDIILSLKTFSFESFDALFYLKKAIKQKDVSYYYNLAIEGYRRNEQIGTALNYEFSLRSLLEFNNNKPLNFTDITPQWLKDYEKYMIEVEDKEKKKKRNSKTTVGIYLRPLRAIFNNAIFDKVISMDFYPFGKRRYAIPAPKGVKKALPEEQLMTLLHGNTQTDEHEKDITSVLALCCIQNRNYATNIKF